ncbi:MAG: alpha-amylase [Anaerolineaceae bacterium]|nr:alpha-amylase [Anaerolineaceae bacterium]
MFEFHVSRAAREKYGFNQSLFSFNGNVIFADFLAARTFTQKINQKRDLVNFPEHAVRSGDINAIGLIDEIFHLIVSLYRQQINPAVFREAYQVLENTYGKQKLGDVLARFTEEFPPVAVFNEELSVDEYLTGETGGVPHTLIALEELIMLWVTNKNPAVSSFAELFDDTFLTKETVYRQVIETLQAFFIEQENFGPDNQDLITLLRSPAVAEPNSLSGQLEYIRSRWGALIGEYLYRLLNSLDLINEEQKAIWAGPGPTLVPNFDYSEMEDDENFSPDSHWMPRTVMVAKNSYVWLYQLSQVYDREINHLDQIPDEELDKLAAWGFNGLWLIGVWERSNASKTIKQLCGNPDAVASAYSLRNYNIALDLGGEAAYENLRDRAWQRGIRLASDMVPNHMGIDSDWVLHHPNWFLALPYSPFPSYSFNGTNLSPDGNIGIYIEDHYYDRSDAAVVFKRVDFRSGDTRFIYHGNDGTSMPWNDTAQLDYLNAEVREGVIQTILHVARKFPIIRFDAAMTLAKKHYQRLWFPEPGTGGAIPSRAEYGMTKEQFDKVFPVEFWREVVDRVAQEVPETLLLAEAFWMMEGYFVRTLGMHRVYNSAFMNMLRNEENAKYRQLIKNTLEFDPEILKRYVNFMNNPDEKTAVEQFGKGDKYFGICTLMSTMPGLPMFGHGQIEGFAEKYGMEYYRPYWEEDPDNYLIQRHQQDIFPLLKRRELFSGVSDFLLFDFFTGEGRVNEDVFAYTNGFGHAHALVVYHNHFGSTKGWIKSSASYLNKNTSVLESQDLYENLQLHPGQNRFLIFRDNHTGLQYIRSTEEIRDKGLYFELDAYQYHVFLDFYEVEESESGQYSQLAGYLNGRGVPSVDEALKELMLAPVLQPLQSLVSPEDLKSLFSARVVKPEKKLSPDLLSIHKEKYRYLIESLNAFTHSKGDIDEIVRETQRGLEAILKLPVFEDRYPFPGSSRYQDLLAYIQRNLASYPFVWYLLILWNDLRLIGKVITDQPEYTEISRGWLDEWGILRYLEHVLIDSGLDTGQAQSGMTILRLLTSQQNWINGIQKETTLSLMESWLSVEEIRAFLNVNRFHEKLWFNKEAFESLLWWMMTIGLISRISMPDTSLTEALEDLLDAFDHISKLHEAEEDSDYQLEKLLDGLK